MITSLSSLKDDFWVIILTLNPFFHQFFANVGMNVGLLPVVGITLPFVSYGGSSLLSSFILLGILSGARATKEEGVLEIG